jgi:hypothetical protein
MKSRFNSCVIIILAVATLLVLFSSCGNPATSSTISTSTPASTTTSSTSTSSPIKVIGLDPILVSDMIILGTVTDLKYDIVDVVEGEHSGKSIHTIFTVSIEKVIKGDSATKELFIRGEGGMTAEVAEIPNPNYLISDKVLVCLGRENNEFYTLLTDGLIWIYSSKYGMDISPLTLSDSIGLVIKIMQANNLPIALPQSEWPPLPASTTLPYPLPTTSSDIFTGPVLNADIIVLGTITGEKYEEVTVTNNGGTGTFTYVIYTLSIEKVIKGDAGLKEVFIKEEAGVVDGGQWYFNLNERTLICLHEINAGFYAPKYSPANTVPDVLWMKGDTRVSSTSLDDVIGRVIVIMQANKIAITLPHSEWPPLPTGGVKWPAK